MSENGRGARVKNFEKRNVQHTLILKAAQAQYVRILFTFSNWLLFTPIYGVNSSVFVERVGRDLRDSGDGNRVGRDLRGGGGRVGRDQRGTYGFGRPGDQVHPYTYFSASIL